jgi:hypothetical protein
MIIDKLIPSSRVTEVNDVATRESGAYADSGLTDPYLTSSFTSLDAANLELSKAIRRSKTESELEIKDEARDNYVRSLYYLLTGFTHHPDAEIREAAQLLLNIFDNYGLSITGESYATESSLITSMLLEFQKPEYAEAIEALSGCAGLIEGLAITQADFEQVRIAWEKEKAKEGLLSNATETKKKVVDIINNKIVVYLRAMVEVNAETYTVFAATFAQIIAENNEVVKKRKQKPDDDKPDEQTD